MSDDGKIVIHAFYNSSCSQRVRLALDYKGIPYKYKGWDISAGGHFTEEYKKISPLQYVPSLEIDGVVLNDSIAILEYLEERFPDKKPLLPKDLKERAAIRSFVQIIASGIQPLQNLRTLNAVAEKSDQEARSAWVRKWVSTGFKALEQILGTTAGKFCFGDELTMADVVLVPQLNAAARFKVDMGEFPILQRVKEDLYQLEVVLNSQPEHQPDYPSAK